MSYRLLTDQIRHYAPARYLCGLVRELVKRSKVKLVG